MNLKIYFSLLSVISAFLLFSVQPLVGKSLLPVMGGSAGTWGATLVFFQLFLFLGYLIAHLLIRYCSRYYISEVVIAFMGLGLFLSRLLLPADYPMSSTEVVGNPFFSVFYSLLWSVGFPYFVISMLSPIFQAWYYRVRVSGNPYFLYSWSNVGSFFALLSYPFVFEPWLSVQEQAFWWTGLLKVLAVLLILLALLVGRVKFGELSKTEEQSSAGVQYQKSGVARLWWLVLPAISSATLVAGTAYITHDLAPVPLLWIFPLALFLLSYVIAFSGENSYRRDLWMVFLFLSFACWDLWSYSEMLVPLLISHLGLFSVCMICHGELYRLRPEGTELTAFYATSSFGSVLGSGLVCLAFPLLFDSNNDFRLLLLIAASLVVFFRFGERHRALSRTFKPFNYAAVLAIVLSFFLIFYDFMEGEPVARGRNFFGTVKVVDFKSKDQRVRAMVNGNTTHGVQLIDNPKLAISYFSPVSPFPVAVRHFQRYGPVDSCVIGLGAGAVAAYNAMGDKMLFLELNPLVSNFARRHFSYLSQADGEIEIMEGDGRILLSNLPESRKFDVLMVDAFSSDSIPVHLLTVEALQLYLDRLKPGGVVVLHLSNRHLNLTAVVTTAVKFLGIEMLRVKFSRENSLTESDFVYILLSPEKGRLSEFEFDSRIDKSVPEKTLSRPWTDSYSSLVGIVRP